MKKYFLNAKEISEKKFFEELETQVRNFVVWNIDNEIDKEEEPYILDSVTYKASTILKKCDPVAYNERINLEIGNGLNDAKDNIVSGYTYLINGYGFKIEER